MKKFLLLFFIGYCFTKLFCQNYGARGSAAPDSHSISMKTVAEPILPLVSQPTPTTNVFSQSAKIAAVTAQRFTGSMNSYGNLFSESKPLQYHPALNTISFLHRKSSTYLPSANGNEGSIVAMYSTNAGASWDSTCIWANATYTAQNPQGAIYNPMGNTSLNNAYIVGCGPVKSGTINAGNWYASKKLSGVGTATPGADQQAIINGISPLKKHSNSQFTFTQLDNGLVRSVGTIVNDPDASTLSAYGLRGAAITKGQFVAGAFLWSIDSFIPPVETNTVSNYRYLKDKPIQAWSENGLIGYVAMLGVRTGVPYLNMRGYQPIIYKTTNGGTSWTILPATNFYAASYACLIARLWPVHTSSTLVIPRFSDHEGWDATVDINGNLHIACTVLGTYSSHLDSLDYVYSFHAEKYSFPGGNLKWPTIYDFSTNLTGGWNWAIVDSMFAEGPSGKSGEPGYLANPWQNGVSAKISYGARIQLSRSTDGKKILYSWTDSDTSIAGNRWNVFPDIHLKGYDPGINKWTPTMNLTNTVPNVNQMAYFHSMSPKAIGSSSFSLEVPFTALSNTGLDGKLPVNHYYMKGAAISSTSYSLNTMIGSCSSLPPPVTLTVNEYREEENNIVIYPNPASQMAEIHIQSTINEVFTIENYSATGQLVESKKVHLPAGESKISLDFSYYNSGMYFVKINSAGIHKTIKLILTK